MASIFSDFPVLNTMRTDQKESLARTGDTSPEAISKRLAAARAVTGRSQKELADEIGISNTTLNSQVKRGAPSIQTMRHLYKNYRIDFNFIIHGDYAQLPGDVQTALFFALAAPSK